MKTTTAGHKNHLMLCVKLSSLHWLLSQSVHRTISQSATSLKKLRWLKKLKAILHHAAASDVGTGPSVIKVLLTSLRINSRFIVGLALMALAVLAKCSYMFFDEMANFPLSPEIMFAYKNHLPMPSSFWYYVNWHYFFIMFGSQSFYLLTYVALLIWIWPVKFNLRFLRYGFIFPIGFQLANIFWLCNVQNDAEYNSMPPFGYVVIGAIYTFQLFLCFKFFLHRKCHNLDLLKAHVRGLVKVLMMTAEEKQIIKNLEHEINEMKEFSRNY